MIEKQKVITQLKQAAETLRKNPGLAEKEYVKALALIKKDMDAKEYSFFASLVDSIKQCPHCGSFHTEQMDQYEFSPDDYWCFECFRWFVPTFFPISGEVPFR